MNLMAWSEHFVTGIDPVDAQHKALVGMINEAAPHLATGGEEARQAAGPLLDKLIRYAATHFSFEETLMQETHVAPAYFEQHLKTHQAFVSEVVQMREQYQRDQDFSGNDLLQFLTSWLTFHILSEDKHLARQVLAIQAGQSPDQAYGALDSPQSTPLAVYNAALIDLFSLLTERNRTLTRANEDVRLAQQQLEIANQGLEERVRERTHALQESLDTLEKTQQRLLQTEKMAAVGQLAAGVAHEINNPVGFVTSNLSTLSGYVTQLMALLSAYERNRAQLPAPQRSEVEALRKAVDLEFMSEDLPVLLAESRTGLERVKRIVSDLQDFSKPDAQQWEKTDLNEALHSALNVASNEVNAKAEVVWKLNPLPVLECMAAQLRQVFINLFVNAAQAIDHHGTITVRSGLVDGKIRIEVSDTGCGMSGDVQKRIFEPFYTTRPVGKGAGLGLSVVWEIIERHQGQINVRSAPGQGTTFRIELPPQRV